MKMALQLVIFFLAMVSARAQTLTNGQAWHYQLTDGSAIMDDCLVCDQLSAWEPLKGTFDLVGTATAGQYRVTNINFRTVSLPDRSVSGIGTLKYSGTTPTMTFDVFIFWYDAGLMKHMTNAPAESPRIFPMIGVNLNEDTASATRVYRLRIQAAPIRELWFSTTTNFTSTNVGGVSNGDLLSSNGAVVKKNSELTERLSIPEGEVGLDAVDVGPRGEIFFSTTTNVESAVNGVISHSDIVTSEGRVYLQGPQLLSAFDVDDPDAGLDALHIVSESEVYFSITKDIPSPGATTLRRGDILSNTGRIVRSEANLLARWSPPAGMTVGVDALYVWPNGEIWFSTENSFTNTVGLAVSSGDIISDQGYVVFRNDQLLNSFTRTEQTDVGLDAFVIVTDTSTSKANTHFLDFSVTDAGVDLRWDSAARFFQVERSFNVEGPYWQTTGIITEQTAHDSILPPSGFFRIRQW